VLAIISKATADFEIIESDLHFKKIAASLADVSAYYPEFKSWLYFTFRAGIYVGERKILVAHSDGDIAGLALLKNSISEKKICTFYVLPEYRDDGVGRSLMHKSLQTLGHNDIGISVSEERHSELSPLLRSCGFSLDSVLPGRYRNEKSEFFYQL
jgi:ribosomal protein S18 acetylase RimI-like enzyme